MVSLLVDCDWELNKEDLVVNSIFLGMETSKVLKDMASELSKSMKPEALPLITAETSSGEY